jgi:tripartite-type tricarboxylate transporter receptor subunit TctC
MYARHLSESLKQNVIIDNRPGGGGALAAAIVAKAPPDGYTLLYPTTSVVINLSLNPNVNYSLKDLAPITQVASFPIAVSIHPSVPAKTVPELVAYAKKRSGVNYGSSGTGSTNHLTGVLFAKLANIPNVHIPFKGAGPMMTAFLGGELEMGITTAFSAVAHINSGKIRAIAVSTLKPLDILPGVPTMASYYPGFNTDLWHGFFTAAGTPAPLVNFLHRELVKAFNAPDVSKALKGGGAQLIASSPSEFATVVAADYQKYAELVKISGAKAD